MQRTVGNEYIISDLHLTHKNIIKYCNRPYEMTDEGITQMKEVLLSMYDALPENCIIWNLGDLIDTKATHSLGELQEITRRMKGPNGDRKLYLVLGNHDNCHTKTMGRISYYLQGGFDKVYDTPVIIDDKFIMSHEPVYMSPNSNFINLYGHLHDKCITEDYFCYDWVEFIQQAKQAREKGLPEPEVKIKYPDRVINTNQYVNICYDYTHAIMRLSDVIRKYR